MDESYWKDIKTGEVHEGGFSIGDTLQAKLPELETPAVKEKAYYCSCCYKSRGDNKHRLKRLATTPKKKLAIWWCPICDGGPVPGERESSSEPAKGEEDS